MKLGTMLHYLCHKHSFAHKIARENFSFHLLFPVTLEKHSNQFYSDTGVEKITTILDVNCIR